VLIDATVDVWQDSASFNILTQFCAGGDLFDSIKEKYYQHKRFSERDASRFARQLLTALAFAHSNNVVHRDIKVSPT
jgi:calcium-dependent protein kinase